jgi:hypothetical protein
MDVIHKEDGAPPQSLTRSGTFDTALPKSYA